MDLIFILQVLNLFIQLPYYLLIFAFCLIFTYPKIRYFYYPILFIWLYHIRDYCYFLYVYCFIVNHSYQKYTWPIEIFCILKTAFTAFIVYEDYFTFLFLVSIFTLPYTDYFMDLKFDRTTDLTLRIFKFYKKNPSSFNLQEFIVQREYEQKQNEEIRRQTEAIRKRTEELSAEFSKYTDDE